MWELDCKESWAPKNWCFWNVVLEKTLESPLDCKEIQPVHPKGDLSLMFIGRSDAEAETPVLWPADAKRWLICKTLMLGKIEGGEEGDGRGWGSWMTSLTRWTWVWVNSGSWWWTGRPGILQSTGSQRVPHDSATELSSTIGSSCGLNNLLQQSTWNRAREVTNKLRYYVLTTSNSIYGYWQWTYYLNKIWGAAILVHNCYFA